jgi:hypothetical protein
LLSTRLVINDIAHNLNAILTLNTRHRKTRLKDVPAITFEHGYQSQLMFVLICLYLQRFKKMAEHSVYTEFTMAYHRLGLIQSIGGGLNKARHWRRHHFFCRLDGHLNHKHHYWRHCNYAFMNLLSQWTEPFLLCDCKSDNLWNKFYFTITNTKLIGPLPLVATVTGATDLTGLLTLLPVQNISSD